VAEWEKLETIADVKRFFAWCIHSIRNQTINPKTAAIMAQIGSYSLKALQGERQQAIAEREFVRIKDILLLLNTMSSTLSRLVLENVADRAVQRIILEGVSAAIGELVDGHRNGNGGDDEQA